VAYSLTKPSGSNAVLLNEGAQNPSFVADVAGTYVLNLAVTFNGEVSNASVSRQVFTVTGASGG
jgi:hypothetical protein